MKNRKKEATLWQRIKAGMLAVSLVALFVLLIFSNELVWLVGLLVVLVALVALMIRSLYRLFLLQYEDENEGGDAIGRNTIIEK